VIAVTDLSVAYAGRQALCGVSFRIGKGEMAGLLGPNGSGKTTLVKALTGQVKPQAGEIALCGRPLSTLSPRERARFAACVPQRQDGVAGFTAAALVLMGRYPGLSFFGNYGAEDERAALAAMREAGVEALADRMAGELSGGELQRVMIARALAQGSDILFLDEASSGLDPARKIEIHDLLARRNRQGLTVFSAIHDLNLAALYCKRLLVLKKGRLVLDGPTEEVFTQKNLSEIYETDFILFRHPACGAPQCLPLPGACAGGAL